METLNKRSWTRKEIDQWEVPTSGLNARVVHCMETAGVQTIGVLRQWKEPQLMALRNFGVGSARNIRWFFNWTKQLEAANGHLQHYRAVLREFLSRQQIFVIEQRYGLTDPLFRPQMKRRTLQEIADMQGGLTRERVRQVEETTLILLRSYLARALAEPLESAWVNRIQKQGAAITSAELSEWVGDTLLGGYQPWGVLLLVTDTLERIQFRYDCFWTIPSALLDRVEQKVLKCLRESSEPVKLDRVVAAVADDLISLREQREHLVTVLLNHHPEISGTVDRRYFLPGSGEPRVIADILATRPEPLHFHDLTRLYNERVQAHSRRGTGHILRVLNAMPRVQRVSRALYTLKAR